MRANSNGGVIITMEDAARFRRYRAGADVRLANYMIGDEIVAEDHWRGEVFVASALVSCYRLIVGRIHLRHVCRDSRHGRLGHPSLDRASARQGVRRLATFPCSRGTPDGSRVLDLSGRGRHPGHWPLRPVARCSSPRHNTSIEECNAACRMEWRGPVHDSPG